VQIKGGHDLYVQSYALLDQKLLDRTANINMKMRTKIRRIQLHVHDRKARLIENDSDKDCKNRVSIRVENKKQKIF